MADLSNFNIQDFLFKGVSGTIISSIMLIIAWLVFVGILGAFAWWYKNRKQYDIKVRIYSKRFGSWKTWDDWGAIYKDRKTGQANGFRLKSEKEIMSPPPYGCLMMSLKGNIIHMLQESTGHYYFLKPEIDDVEKLCDEDKVLAAKLRVVPEDARLWQSASRDKIDMIYSKRPWWKDLVAFVPFVICAMLILIMIYLSLIHI